MSRRVRVGSPDARRPSAGPDGRARYDVGAPTGRATAEMGEADRMSESDPRTPRGGPPEGATSGEPGSPGGARTTPRVPRARARRRVGGPAWAPGTRIRARPACAGATRRTSRRRGRGPGRRSAGTCRRTRRRRRPRRSTRRPRQSDYGWGRTTSTSGPDGTTTSGMTATPPGGFPADPGAGWGGGPSRIRTPTRPGAPTPRGRDPGSPTGCGGAAGTARARWGGPG